MCSGWMRAFVDMGCAWCVKQKVGVFEKKENKILLWMLWNSEVLFMFNSSSWDLSQPLLLFKDQIATLFLEESFFSIFLPLFQLPLSWYPQATVKPIADFLS